MDEPTRKKAKIADPRPGTTKRRLQPKSPPPLPGSYSRPREGRSAAATAVPVAFDATTVANDTCPPWGVPNRWSSFISLEPLTSWDHGDAVKTMGFATQDRDYFAMSAAVEAELSFPIMPHQHQNDVVDSSGNGSGSGDPPSNKPFEKWQASASTSTHNSAPLPPPPFAGFLSHPPMSYTAAHTHSRSHVQSLDSVAPFSPGSDVAGLNPGFTSAVACGATGTSLESSLVNPPGTPAFPQIKPRIGDDCTFEPTFNKLFPATHYHPGHVPNVDSYHGDDETRFLSHHITPWYGEEPLGLSLDLAVIARPSPPSRTFLYGTLGFEGGSELPTTALCGPMSVSDKVVLGGERPERSRRPRGQLLPKDREETSRTRKWKACIRCRMQKIRCIPDPDRPRTACCLCCKKVLLLETKKVIHRIPCLRWNLNEVALFRVGGLGFTKRWTGVCVENIPSSDWVDDRILTIGVCVSKLLCDPIPLRVRRFKPNSTDVQYRYWKCKETDPAIRITIPPYALADVDATSEGYRRFVKENAEEAIRRFVGDSRVNDYVRRTFSVALHHGTKAAHKEFGKAKGDPAKLFCKYFRLWLASRFTLGSAYITDGYENLEGTTAGAAYPGAQFLSRMITAQFDSIGYKHVLVTLKREVLDELWLLMQKRTNTTFFTVYLIVFMMLHEISVACQDRRRRAKEQGLKTYYDLEDATAKIKHGADIILGHWHYYKGDIDPLSMTQDSMARAFGTESAEEIRLLMDTYQEYSQMKKKPRSEMEDEGSPLYLVSQMFEHNWQPTQSCWP
ncbi:putative tetratricopeptide repeat domain-containing protein [Rosellinia necatrix]|uniref:Putative tetratricopeptide repeat domain-containing protein n=1 Tax=Rosellinia necatrix TaxID=77044 RepID=A0A1W2TVX0_ROSNE|nr:putative tetratricopeptide repeat domain-containing protein [Rosellinia necatrix]